MRIWSVSPEYLDTVGLVACWRETLLAKHVLEGKTKGYKNHPQLERFKNQDEPLVYINAFLYEIYKEALKRNYKFDLTKIDLNLVKKFKHPLKVNDKQLKYEFNHLQNKLKVRDKKKYLENNLVKNVKPNLILTVVKGNIENWERVLEHSIKLFKNFINED